MFWEFWSKLIVFNADNLLSVLSALDNISKDSTEERKRSLRCQAIQEILTSEVSYLHQLEVIMQVIPDLI
jgi:hypothetical protein